MSVVPKDLYFLSFLWKHALSLFCLKIVAAVSFVVNALIKIISRLLVLQSSIPQIHCYESTRLRKLALICYKSLQSIEMQLVWNFLKLFIHYFFEKLFVTIRGSGCQYYWNVKTLLSYNKKFSLMNLLQTSTAKYQG